MPFTCCTPTLSGTFYIRDRPWLLGESVNLTSSLPYTGAGPYVLIQGATPTELLFKFSGTVTTPVNCDLGLSVVDLEAVHGGVSLITKTVPIPSCGAATGISITIASEDQPVPTNTPMVVNYTVTTDPAYVNKEVKVHLQGGATVTVLTDANGDASGGFHVYYDCLENNKQRLITAQRTDTGAVASDSFLVQGPCNPVLTLGCCDVYSIHLSTDTWEESYTASPDATGGLVFGGPAPIPVRRIGPDSSGCPRTGLYNLVLPYDDVDTTVQVTVSCILGTIPGEDPPPSPNTPAGAPPDCPDSSPYGAAYSGQTEGVLYVTEDTVPPCPPTPNGPCPSDIPVYSNDGVELSVFCTSCLTGIAIDVTLPVEDAHDSLNPIILVQ